MKSLVILLIMLLGFGQMLAQEYEWKEFEPSHEYPYGKNILKHRSN